MIRFTSLVLAFAIAGCASTGSINSVQAQRGVFAAKEAYAVVLKEAVRYESQPRCTDTVTTQCSDPQIVAQVRKASAVASSALDAAEAAVRTPQIGTDATSRAVETANAALAAFSALLPLLGAIK
jgi:hypothetical protein